GNGFIEVFSRQSDLDLSKGVFGAMKKLLLLTYAIFLVGCGGGGDSISGEPGTGADVCAAGSGSTPTYTKSEPLADNSNASAYKVLLMGNSHAAGLRPTLERLLILGQAGKPVDVRLAPNPGFLAERVNDGESEQMLECEQWTHVILQGQKYSTSGSSTYPTTAAEYWIRGSKELGATPIMFPEHPRKDNTWEGQTLWDLHTGIAARENTCVAPVGLVWDEVIFRDPTLVLHQLDGNHASAAGSLLTALVFYQIITGQPVESLPELSAFDIDSATEQIMKESASSLLFVYPPCVFGV
ncbi:MAG: hypothetical protein OEV10_14555, partial [Gammaproteobacteria bacterium]|nr:hypothetical protein [Gammaproteobacteria bacterium]